MMATGYVHPVADGKVTTLKDFALLCSRAMGALITMRDDPSGPPPRELPPPDMTFYESTLKAAQERLDKLASETEEQRRQRVEAEYQTALASAREYDAREAAERERVVAMRARVEAWTGAPEGLKEFMLQQIDSSLHGGDYRAADHATRRDPDDDWRHAVEAVGRAHANIERERALHKSRSAWLEQLWASLEGVE